MGSTCNRQMLVNQVRLAISEKENCFFNYPYEGFSDKK